jgi:acyl-coenzyme A synthetase/AMP-(fatty) acid ligase
VHAFYGASECGGISYDRAGDAAERGSVGTAIDGVSLKLDPATGRLRVRSPAVAETYLPEPSAELADGAFLTGDLAELEAGDLRLLGRADDWVMVRGRNVNPREVEVALERITGVEEASVFGVDGPDGPRSVLRAVVAVPGGGVDAAAVVDDLRSRLSAHKVPRSVTVVRELPRTDRGKIDREILAGRSGP